MRVRRVGIYCSASGHTHRNDAKVADAGSVADGEGNPESAKTAVHNTCLGDGGGCSCRIYTADSSVKLGKLSNKQMELLASFATAKMSLELRGAM